MCVRNAVRSNYLSVHVETVNGAITSDRLWACHAWHLLCRRAGVSYVVVTLEITCALMTPTAIDACLLTVAATRNRRTFRVSYGLLLRLALLSSGLGGPCAGSPSGPGGAPALVLREFEGEAGVAAGTGLEAGRGLDVGD